MRRVLLFLALVALALGQKPNLNTDTQGNLPGNRVVAPAVPLSAGGTAQTSWTAGRCVQVNSGGTALESASTACGAGGGGGEANTASNAGAGGVGPFLNKVGVDLRFKNINAASSKITVANDVGNNEVDLDVSEASLTLSNLGGSVTDGQVPNNITIDLATTATALAANGANCAGNDFALGVNASGAAECAQPAFSNLSGSATDAQIPDTITASNYLLLTGGTLTGQVITDNLGIEFDESDTNPTCGAGNFNVYADLSENKLKKCENGVASDLDTGGTADAISVNGSAATDANIIDTASSGTVPAATWTLNTGPSPDTIAVTIGPAGTGAAGVVTTGSQSFAGTKTFTGTTIHQAVTGTYQFNGITATADALILANSDSAALGVQQMSPRIRFSGSGWRTASGGASRSVDAIEELLPIQGVNEITGELQWKFQIAGGGYATRMLLTSDGYLDEVQRAAFGNAATNGIQTWFDGTQTYDGILRVVTQDDTTALPSAFRRNLVSRVFLNPAGSSSNGYWGMTSSVEMQGTGSIANTASTFAASYTVDHVGTGNMYYVTGQEGGIEIKSTGTITSAVATKTRAWINGAGSIGAITGHYIDIQGYDAGSTFTTDVTGMYLGTGNLGTGPTTSIGVHIGQVMGGTNVYGLYIQGLGTASGTKRGFVTMYSNNFHATGGAAVVGVTVQGAAAQTADLSRWENSSSTILSKITSSGEFVGPLNVETSGTTVTTVEYEQWNAAICQNVTASTTWSKPTSNAAAEACVTGSNTQYGVLDFDAATDESVQNHLRLPADWTGTVDLDGRWFAAATTGDVRWGIQTSCVADAETGDPVWNAAQFVLETAKGTTLQHNVFTLSGVTMTGCAADEELFIKVYRDADDGADTMAGDARLVGIRLKYRRGQ